MAPAAPPGRPWFFEMKQVESLKWEAYYYPRNENTRNQALAARLSSTQVCMCVCVCVCACVYTLRCVCVCVCVSVRLSTHYTA